MGDGGRAEEWRYGNGRGGVRDGGQEDWCDFDAGAGKGSLSRVNLELDLGDSSNMDLDFS